MVRWTGLAPWEFEFPSTPQRGTLVDGTEFDSSSKKDALAKLSPSQVSLKRESLLNV